MIITRTPFRISFFGGGTDLPDYYLKYGGEVLSTTIDKYLYITCRHMPPYWDYKHRFVYGSKSEFVSDLDEIEHPSIRETMRFLEVDFGLDMHYNTDIPARSGMGSSSSFTVGLLNAIYGLNGRMVTKEKLAEDAIYIEQKKIGESVGSQDQTAASYGGLNHIVFNENGSIDVYPVTIKKKRLELLNSHLFLVFTGFQRFASDIEKKKIKSISRKEIELNKMKSFVKDSIEILSSNVDICEFGKLLDDTWRLKRSLSDGVSSDMIDSMYKSGIKAGAIGGKLLGAGGGGFMLCFAKKEDMNSLKRAFADYITVPFSFESDGSKVIYYLPE